MYELNDKIKNLEPYEPISGTYQIRLDANECPVNLPDEVRREFAARLQEIAFNRYPDPMAGRLVDSFAEYYNIKPALVTAGNGSDELIFLVESAFMQKGDKMLVVSPDFSMYNFYSSICEVQSASFLKGDSLEIDVDALIRTINRDKIDLVIFSNPCNPTGKGITRAEAEKLVSSVEALVILDEAYMDFWTESLLDKIEDYSNLIIFRTVSNLVGAAALRLGFAVANPAISKAIKAVKSPYNVNSVSQAFGEIIYRQKETLKNRQKMIVNNKEMLYNGLVELCGARNDCTVYSSVANFVFMKTGCSREIWEYLKRQSIVVRLMGEYLRITAGTAEEVSAVLRALGAFFER
ncbi:MAG: aminotransferase class I/II-fold pyridoxal phosphate-dependent enzyme [Ruminococcus sp.]|nr:aminotransferase class I/II-fold pyridoxal phosphate-dependent enzyme [Ruminococcus sp.]